MDDLDELDEEISEELNEYLKSLSSKEKEALLYYAEENNITDAADRAGITKERLKEIIEKIQQFPKKEVEQGLPIKNSKDTVPYPYMGTKEQGLPTKNREG